MNARLFLEENLTPFIFTAIRVIFIAIVFEFISWWAGRRLESMTTSFITMDSGREANWRIRRRTTLRQTPKIISRTLCFMLGIILVLDVMGVPVLPLSLAVGAVIALFGAALLPLLRDIAQGYALLAEDTLAVGDVVEVQGRRGTVERFTLRGLWLRDSEGRAHCLSNRDVKHVTVQKRKTDEPVPPLPGQERAAAGS